MIIKTEELSKFKKKLTMVDGAFDPLHAGHIAYVAEARKFGMPILLNIASDEYTVRKHPILLPAEKRALVLEALKDVDYVHICNSSTAEVLSLLQPKYYVKGQDWSGRLPVEEVKVCDTFDIEIAFLDTILDSSTSLIKQVNTQMTKRSFKKEVAELEQLLGSQTVVQSEHYSEDYFLDQWREGGNSYALETRREMEGRNPQLIKDVFKPQKVLDLGCGPGALMYLLNEIGVYSEGVDFAESTKQIAPEAVRDKITIASVTNPPLADNSFDLVICREVLEHLTVLQIVQTVRSMCRVTSKYVYVTTRFHPEPESLLSVTTQFDVDPSHISLMNKDFLHVLFLLEGMKSRPDLVEQLDWLKKDRVLVFEKIG
jgi:cytidyltransferase-like protein